MNHNVYLSVCLSVCRSVCPNVRILGKCRLLLKNPSPPFDKVIHFPSDPLTQIRNNFDRQWGGGVRNVCIFQLHYTPAP